MTRQTFFFATPVLLFLLLAGCQGTLESTDAPTGEGGTSTENPSTDSRPDAPLLRLQNESGMDFSSVTVRFPNEEERFEAIAAGEASDYHAFENAYSYGSVTVESGGETYEVRAIDYTGETPLQAGRYTYALDIVESNLEVTFTED